MEEAGEVRLVAEGRDRAKEVGTGGKRTTTGEVNEVKGRKGEGREGQEDERGTIPGATSGTTRV